MKHNAHFSALRAKQKKEDKRSKAKTWLSNWKAVIKRTEGVNQYGDKHGML